MSAHDNYLQQALAPQPATLNRVDARLARLLSAMAKRSPKPSTRYTRMMTPPGMQSSMPFGRLRLIQAARRFANVWFTPAVSRAPCALVPCISPA